jgi:predicted nucleic acid-binding Zn ribbon protein
VDAAGGQNLECLGWEALTVDQPKKQVCMLCGKPSTKGICQTCSEKVRGEALDKKKKQEKIKE